MASVIAHQSEFEGDPLPTRSIQPIQAACKGEFEAQSQISTNLVDSAPDSVSPHSTLTPDEIEYLRQRATCLDKAGAEMQNASYQAGEYAGEMFKAGYYVCVYAAGLFAILRSRSAATSGMAKNLKELGF